VVQVQGGGPFFMCGPGDPEGFLFAACSKATAPGPGDQLELIRKLGSTGANSIYLMAARSHGVADGRVVDQKEVNVSAGDRA